MLIPRGVQLSILIALLLAPISVALGGTPSEVLLRLVGSDAGLCLELSQLETEVPLIMRSEIAERLKNMELYRNWIECEDYDKFMRSKEGVEKFANKPIGQIASELFGRNVVIAVYPSQEDQLVAVLLTEAANREKLDWFLETWNRQKRVEVTTLSHADQSYYRRARTRKDNRGTETLYYLRLGHIFALSDRQSMMRRIIDLHLSKPHSSTENTNPATREGNLYESALFRKTQRSLSPKSFARVYFNPHSCGKVAELFAAQQGDPTYQILASCWKKCQSIGLGIRFDDGLIVEAHAHYDSASLPAAWKQFVEISSQRPEFLDRIPDNAVAIMCGRCDSTLINRLINATVLRPNEKQWTNFRQISRGMLLGLDLFDDVLPSLQPNWTAYLVPRGNTKGNVPADALIAVELPPVDKSTQKNGRPSLRSALDNGLNTGLNFLAATEGEKSQQESAVVKSSENDGTLIRWIDRLGDYQPAYALSSDSLILASSPRLIEEFLSPDSSRKLPSSPLYQKLTAPHLTAVSHIFLVDVARLRELVHEHHSFFEHSKDESRPPARSNSEKRLSRVEDILQLFDAAFIATHVDDQRLGIVLGTVARPSTRVSSRQLK